MASTEISRVNNSLLSLNGTDSSGEFRCYFHAPWSDGVWYFDMGNISSQGNRANSAANVTAVGSRTVLSGYKSSTEVRNGFRLNKGIRYFSTNSTAATVSGGTSMNVGGGANHYVFGWTIFNSPLSSSDEVLMEDNI